MTGLDFVIGAAAITVFVAAGIFITERLRSVSRPPQDHKESTANEDTTGIHHQELPPSITALINAIRDEGKANRDQESGEDKGKKRREIFTIFVLTLTLAALAATYCGIRDQVDEMVKAYGPIQTQAEASMAAQRAWMGPSDANIVGDIVVGQGVKTIISYANFGHEPATRFSTVGGFNLISLDNWTNGFARVAIAKFSKNCLSTMVGVGGDVKFPATGVGYQYPLVSNSDIFEQKDRVLASLGLTQGTDIITFSGCFVYRSISKDHHTSFCFYYKAGESNLAHLSICPFPAEAD